MRRGRVVALLHREVLPIGVGARGSVARVNGKLTSFAAYGRPVCDITRENLLNLAFRELGDGIVGVDDDGHAVVGDRGVLEVHAFSLTGGNFRGFGVA